MIPDYIINWFKDRFKTTPSQTILQNKTENYVKELTSKSTLLHYQKMFVEEKNLNMRQLFEYDPSGIFVYSELINDDKKDHYNVFILSLVDKQKIVEFVLHNLNKKK